jgi:hypothetical protein
MTRRDESGFRHGLRVRIGAPTGPKGKLLRCTGRNWPYWKVHLDNGEWVWPDDIIIDGAGDRVERCLDCRLPFMGTLGDLLCPGCQESQFGTPADRKTAVDDLRYRPRTRAFHRRRSHI